MQEHHGYERVGMLRREEATEECERPETDGSSGRNLLLFLFRLLTSDSALISSPISLERDLIEDSHPVGQCLMDRASRGDLGEALPLGLGEGAADCDAGAHAFDHSAIGGVALPAVDCMNAVERVLGRHRFESDPLVSRIQPERDRSAGRQASGQHFIGSRPQIVTTEIDRLVHHPLVPSVRNDDPNPFPKSRRDSCHRFTSTLMQKQE